MRAAGLPQERDRPQESPLLQHRRHQAGPGSGHGLAASTPSCTASSSWRMSPGGAGRGVHEAAGQKDLRQEGRRRGAEDYAAIDAGVNAIVKIDYPESWAPPRGSRPRGRDNGPLLQAVHPAHPGPAGGLPAVSLFSWTAACPPAPPSTRSGASRGRAPVDP